RLIENMAELVKDKRIEMISDLRDESDRDGMRIVVELKREANAQVVLNQLYTYTQMQETVGVIMLALVNGIPRVLTLKEVLQEYIKFQFEIITRRTRFELKKAKEREHILEGLKIVVDNTDEVIHIIRSAADINTSKANLIERFAISDIQSGAIVAMRLGQLSGMERIKIEEELASILKRVAELNEILENDPLVYGIIKDELAIIRAKFSDDRRTDIETVTGEVDIEDLIPVTDCVITLTHLGYIKRQPVDVYRTQHRGGRGMSGMTKREEDFAEELFVCSTHDYVLFFTNRGKMYRIKGYEIPESSRTGKGNHVVNLLPLEKDEKITAMIRVGELDEESYLVMVTRAGTIKRTQLSAYKNIRKAGIIAINLEGEDELAWVRNTNGSTELIIATAQGKAIRFSETDLRPMGRNAMGVRAIRLQEGDYVVGMARVHEGATLLTVSENGRGRRTELDEYTLQHRGGLGNRNYKVTKNGAVAGIKSVYEGDDAIIISDDGVIIRIPVGEINVQSRYGGGVRVMRLAEDSRIVTLACAPREEEAGSALLTEGDPAEAEETEDGSAPQAPGRDTDEDDAEEIGEEIAEEIAEDGDTEQ
ncbi:MAG: DNA gyrase C-terminal beta-propeller domain-containing protein, partial [Oscillospiraceae bacterium]